MVVIVDLSADISDPHAGPQWRFQKPIHSSIELPKPVAEDVQDDRPNLNLNGFSAALSCYPIVSQLASLLDLNTLHNLSRTCRQFRANLLQFRNQLVTQSLRCSKEDIHLGAALADRLRESHMIWRSNKRVANEWPGHRITSGKVGKCARDMVGECRRCGTVVCRNCTAKPPPTSSLSGRHRRLCRTCLSVPFALHTSSDPPASPPEPRNSHSPSPSPLYRMPTPTPLSASPSPKPFAAAAFHRTPCTCPDQVWLCQSCGHNLRTNDTNYVRAWNWRARYTTYLGGLGTGIGEGNEAVECGRRGECFEAMVVEHEVERDDAADAEAGEEGGRTWEGGGFEVQEMEGVGGVVKKKVKMMVRIGKWVEEWEDGLSAEGRVSVLEREISGKVRSWCAWCERVIPSRADLEAEAKTDVHA